MNDEKVVNRENILAEKIISSVKAEILIKLKFLDFAISFFNNAEIKLDNIKFGTDGISLYFANDFIINTYYNSYKYFHRLFLHSLFHSLFGHVFVKKIDFLSIWGIACDISIESIIDSLNIPLFDIDNKREREKEYKNIKKLLLNSTNNDYLLADHIFPLLMTFDDNKIKLLEKIFYRDDHDMWKNVIASSNDELHNDSNLTDVSDNWKIISERMITNLETFSIGIGNSTDGLLKLLKLKNRRKYDYKDFLKKFMVYKEVMKESLDEFDYIYYYLGFQYYKKMPLIESVEYKDDHVLDEFVIAIDTSGSVFENEVKLFLETMSSIFEQNIKNRRVNFHIIQSDMEIQDHLIINNKVDFDKYINNLIIKGGGGTDFCPVFKFVDELIFQCKIKKLKGLLYFTDGIGLFPTKIPKYESVFVFYDEFFNSYTTPSWAKKLILTKEDFI